MLCFMHLHYVLFYIHHTFVLDKCTMLPVTCPVHNNQSNWKANRSNNLLQYLLPVRLLTSGLHISQAIIHVLRISRNIAESLCENGTHQLEYVKKKKKKRNRPCSGCFCSTCTNCIHNSWLDAAQLLLWNLFCIQVTHDAIHKSGTPHTGTVRSRSRAFIQYLQLLSKSRGFLWSLTL